jgi:hypothetical protein
VAFKAGFALAKIGFAFAATFLTAAVLAEAALAATCFLAGLLFAADFADFFAVFVTTRLWSLIPLYIRGRESISVLEASASII